MRRDLFTHKGRVALVTGGAHPIADRMVATATARGPAIQPASRAAACAGGETMAVDGGVALAGAFGV